MSSRSEAFGRAVRERRLDAGLSQERLGYQSGLDRTYISGVERGVRNPTLAVIWKLAEGLDTTPSELLARSEQLSK